MMIIRPAKRAYRLGKRVGVAAIVAVAVFYPGLILLHYEPMVIVTGSMQKTIPVGSLVVDQKVNPQQLHVGDVISFQKPLGAKGIDTHRIVAISWPVCQTPPRVVIHQICVENPSRITRKNRSINERTPARPVNHQASPTHDAARAALIPGSSWSATCGPTTATIGMRAIPGNGPNGT